MKNLWNIIDGLEETGDIIIKHNGETYKFNLYQELKIDNKKIEAELKTCATPLAFLSTQAAELEYLVKVAELEKDRAWARAYVKYKKMISTETQRPYSDDMAKAKATKDLLYLKAAKDHLSVQKDYKKIVGAVKAFEVRNQTIISMNVNSRKI